MPKNLLVLALTGKLKGLRAITIHAARICGVDDRIGSIEPGKDADFAIFDGNPMEIFTNTLMTIIDGKIVYRNESTGTLLAKKMRVQ